MTCRTTTLTHGRPHARAFTLVELLVVLAIIAVVAGIVSPYARGHSQARLLQDAALTLAQHVKYAQALAVDMGRPARLRVDVQVRRYCVEIARDLAGQDFVPAPGPPGVPQALPEGVRFDELEWKSGQQADALLFAPTEQWTTGRLQLVSDHGSVAVKVSQGLGHVEVAGLQPPGS